MDINHGTPSNLNKNGDVAEPKTKISNHTSNLINGNYFDEKTRISDVSMGLGTTSPVPDFYKMF